MISFNLTSPAQEELSNEWKTNHRLASHDSPPRQEFRQPFIVETLKLNSRKHFKSFNAQDRIKNFRRIATVETKCQFEFDRDEEPLSTDPIYLINDAVDYLTHVLQPVFLFLAFPWFSRCDQPSGSLYKRKKIPKRSTLHHKSSLPRTTTTSFVTDCDEQETFINLVGNLGQNVRYVPKSDSNLSKGLN